MQLRHLIVTLSIILATSNSFANEEFYSDAENNFNQGQILYGDEKFEAAVNKFSEAIKQSPDDSRYHHWLAKSYGELAETSGWLKAMRFAENAKKSLERAVELDPKNIAALTDLMKYYRDAPGFLGGSDKKAEEISIRLKILKGKNTISFNYHHVTGNEQHS